ncbi:MAG: hypothetical protein QHC90_25540 [Shinella sp.]|nr:hypothetical protein [Shinella sp.]
MSTTPQKRDPGRRREHAPDRRDRLILALYAELKAERQTRQALEETIRNGGLSREVLSAMASDPVPVITSEDIAEIERYLAADIRPTGTRTSGGGTNPPPAHEKGD